MLAPNKLGRLRSEESVRDGADNVKSGTPILGLLCRAVSVILGSTLDYAFLLC